MTHKIETENGPVTITLDGEGTMAEQVSRLFDDDGQRWETENGIGLEEVAEAVSSHTEWRDGERTGDVVRYEFSDASTIVVAGDCWDLGLGLSCYCLADADGGEHAEDCIDPSTVFATKTVDARVGRHELTGLVITEVRTIELSLSSLVELEDGQRLTEGEARMWQDVCDDYVAAFAEAAAEGVDLGYYMPASCDPEDMGRSAEAALEEALDAADANPALRR